MFNPDFSYFKPPPPFSIIQVYLAAPQVPPHGCFPDFDTNFEGAMLLL